MYCIHENKITFDTTMNENKDSCEISKKTYYAKY
jgi:hypothetical protein